VKTYISKSAARLTRKEESGRGETFCKYSGYYTHQMCGSQYNAMLTVATTEQTTQRDQKSKNECGMMEMLAATRNGGIATPIKSSEVEG
jgi:hypothetical protein